MYKTISLHPKIQAHMDLRLRELADAQSNASNAAARLPGPHPSSAEEIAEEEEHHFALKHEIARAMSGWYAPRQVSATLTLFLEITASVSVRVLLPESECMVVFP